jgi:hypothetical protein
MEKSLKIIYDFFRLWIMWGDIKEAWQDAKTINDPKSQKEMNELDNSMKKHFDNWDNGVH